MKTIFFFTLLLLVAPTVFGGDTNNLTIVIPNVKTNKGSIRIGLFKNASDFPKENRQYKTVLLKAAPNTRHTFKNLPKGEYAIAILHDENADGKCNVNALGIPTEGYGFSNNIRPKLSVPSFNSAKFSIIRDKTISVKLIY